MNEATHKDEFGNHYKMISEGYVLYWDLRLHAWVQDIGKDFSHLITIS